MNDLPNHSDDGLRDGDEHGWGAGVSRSSTRFRQSGIKVLAYLPLLLWAIPTIIACYFVIVTSLKTNVEIFQGVWALPESPVFENYVRAWRVAHVGQFFVNSVLVTIGSVALTAVTSSLAAYVLARFKFPGSNTIYVLFLAGLMIPIHLTLVPLYETVADLHMANSLWGLMIVSSVFSVPFSVFVLTSFFRSLPSELGDAALVDGCSELGLFWRIMLPLGAPGVITASIFNMLYTWNDYLLPLILIVSSRKRTLPLGVMNLSGAAASMVDWAALYAGLVLLIVPSLLAYLLLQSRIEESITLGSLK